jgi:hypothetical protein
MTAKKDQEKSAARKHAGSPGADKVSSKSQSGGKSASFEESERGTSDEEYNLVSILYHALQGAETYLDYVEDAEESGDEELCRFFRDVQQEEARRAERAKQLLASRIDSGESRGRGRGDQEDEALEEGAST